LHVLQYIDHNLAQTALDLSWRLCFDTPITPCLRPWCTYVKLSE